MAKGYTVLLAILVILLIGTTLAIFAFSLSMGSSRSVLVLSQSKKTQALSNLCSELAVKKIKDTPYFTGQESFNFSEGDCDYDTSSVIEGENISWKINATGTSAGSMRRNHLELSAVIPPEPELPVPTLDSWKEVADFD